MDWADDETPTKAAAAAPTWVSPDNRVRLWAGRPPPATAAVRICAYGDTKTFGVQPLPADIILYVGGWSIYGIDCLRAHLAPPERPTPHTAYQLLVPGALEAELPHLSVVNTDYRKITMVTSRSCSTLLRGLRIRTELGEVVDDAHHASSAHVNPSHVIISVGTPTGAPEVLCGGGGEGGADIEAACSALAAFEPNSTRPLIVIFAAAEGHGAAYVTSAAFPRGVLYVNVGIHGDWNGFSYPRWGSPVAIDIM